MMDEARFWQIIESSRAKALATPREPITDLLDVHEKTLADALRTLPPADVAAFQHRFDDLRLRAYRDDLWAAAYWLLGGCGDDGFIDFRSSLISLGREWFERILADPDELAETVGRKDVPYLGAEGFQYIAGRVYKELTGRDMPFDDDGNGSRQELVIVGDERIDTDDETAMAERFPKLVAKLPNMGD